MSDRRFGVLILSSGRPASVKTLRTIRRSGYTGPAWVVCDDQEPHLAGYRAEFGDVLVTFPYDEARAGTDECDSLGPGRVVVYARNACWGIAERLGLTHFL
ncbi:MAG: hypothetical protein ACOCUN_02600, partial [Jiangellaceae bacterium]